MIDPGLIERIEDSPLDEFDQINLILTALGRKPASFLELESLPWREGDEQKQCDPEAFQEIIELIRELGLYAEAMLPKIHAQPHRGGRPRFVTVTFLLVAENLEALVRLINAFSIDDDVALGLAVGYPLTAVQAFAARNLLEEFPDEVSDELAAFTTFRLSSYNWREELELVQGNAEAIKQVSPYLYAVTTGELDDDDLCCAACAHQEADASVQLAVRP